MILPVKEKAIKLEYHDSLEGNQEAVLDHLSSDSPIPPRENSALAMGEPLMMNNQENMVFFLYPFLQWPPFWSFISFNWFFFTRVFVTVPAASLRTMAGWSNSCRSWWNFCQITIQIDLVGSSLSSFLSWTSYWPIFDIIEKPGKWQSSIFQWQFLLALEQLSFRLRVASWRSFFEEFQSICSFNVLMVGRSKPDEPECKF